MGSISLHSKYYNELHTGETKLFYEFWLEEKVNNSISPEEHNRILKHQGDQYSGIIMNLEIENYDLKIQLEKLKEERDK